MRRVQPDIRQQSLGYGAVNVCVMMVLLGLFFVSGLHCLHVTRNQERKDKLQNAGSVLNSHLQMSLLFSQSCVRPYESNEPQNTCSKF